MRFFGGQWCQLSCIVTSLALEWSAMYNSCNHPAVWHVVLQVYGEEKALPYVVPSPNVRIECPLALVDKVLDNRPAAAREAANAFANFLFTSEAQVRLHVQHAS